MRHSLAGAGIGPASCLICLWYSRKAKRMVSSSRPPFLDTPAFMHGEEKMALASRKTSTPLRGPLFTRAATGPVRLACASSRVSAQIPHVPFATDIRRGCKLGRRSQRPVGDSLSTPVNVQLPSNGTLHRSATYLVQASLTVNPCSFPLAGRVLRKPSASDAVGCLTGRQAVMLADSGNSFFILVL